LLYRAPLLAVLPLVAVFVAVQVALKLLALLAQAELVTLFQGAQTYITVVMYGTGVDYSFFLIARYREELGGGAALREAAARAVGKTGAALTASAGTVTLGIGMMAFEQFGQFHHARIHL